MLAVVSSIGNLISGKFRSSVNKAIPYMVLLVGILFILRGLALGIPYVSPKDRMLQPHEKMHKENIEMTMNFNFSKDQVKTPEILLTLQKESIIHQIT